MSNYLVTEGPFGNYPYERVFNEVLEKYDNERQRNAYNYEIDHCDRVGLKWDTRIYMEINYFSNKYTTYHINNAIEDKTKFKNLIKVLNNDYHIIYLTKNTKLKLFDSENKKGVDLMSIADICKPWDKMNITDNLMGSREFFMKDSRKVLLDMYDAPKALKEKTLSLSLYLYDNVFQFKHM